jgi:hypothetical protein
VHAEVIPHLTVAQAADPQALETVAAEFLPAAAGRLPISARAAEVALMDNRNGPWALSGSFRLGGA